MKCPHYSICVAQSSDTLCSDLRCPLNKKIHEKEEEDRLLGVKKILDDYKKSLGVNSFLDKNKKG